ncbi:MAG: type II secretion system F family protein [Nanoarchaeota archaeon]|nr:type II secretion system F family protein [Nanoarchaeota archaeon]
MSKKIKFKIPFTFSGLDKLRKKSVFFQKPFKHKPKSKLQKNLEISDIALTREEYLGISLKTTTYSFIILYILSSTILFLTNIKNMFILAIPIAFLFSGFVFFSQTAYPKVYVRKKQREIEKNLIPALEDMLIQLNSGVPLFSIIVNISVADYGFLSDEFKKMARKINAGIPQIKVLEEIGKNNASVFFRRALWQMSNGMRAGSDISVVIKESIKALNEEQIVQIQNYGNKLNPLIMFYMLISVILPALSITFLTIISSMVSLPKTMTTLLFISLFVIVVFIQIIFLGAIKSIRPSLL